MSDTCQWCIRTSKQIDSIEFEKEELEQQLKEIQTEVQRLTEIIKQRDGKIGAQQ